MLVIATGRDGSGTAREPDIARQVQSPRMFFESTHTCLDCVDFKEYRLDRSSKGDKTLGSRLPDARETRGGGRRRRDPDAGSGCADNHRDSLPGLGRRHGGDVSRPTAGAASDGTGRQECLKRVSTNGEGRRGIQFVPEMTPTGKITTK